MTVPKERTENVAKVEPKGRGDEAVNGVLVRVVDSDQGATRQVQPIGDTGVTEIPTLLRLAAKDVERELGI